MQQPSAHDAAFLYSDTTHSNANVTLVHIYNQSTAPGGRVRFKGLLKYVESRLHLSPVFRQRLLRVPLVNRAVLRLAKSGRCGRENEFINAMRPHRIQQTQRVSHVVAVVLVRLLHRLAHLNERGKVHHSIKTLRQNGIEHGAVAKVALHKVAAQHCIAVATGEVIKGG